MDRESFPQLLENDTGWPQLMVPWSVRGDEVRVSVWEDEEYPTAPVIDIVVPPPVTGCKQVIVRLNGVEIHNG